MQRKDFETAFLSAFKTDTITNYIVPGLESLSLGQAEGFHLRMFNMTQRQMVQITPHSHRFDLLSFVLSGLVTHHTYRKIPEITLDSDHFAVLKQQGQLGDYSTTPVREDNFECITNAFPAGASYFLEANMYHSLVFAKGTRVLIVEGPSYNNSEILVPVVNGEPCSTLFTAPWMFKR